jgi:hypothetical protein
MFTTKRSHDPAAQIYGVDNVDQKLTMSKRMDEKKTTVARAATVRAQSCFISSEGALP